MEFTFFFVMYVLVMGFFGIVMGMEFVRDMVVRSGNLRRWD